MVEHLHSRRTFMSTAPVIAAAALPAAGANAVGPDLSRLIEAHKAAWATRDSASAAYSAAEAAAPRPPLVRSLGRAYELIIGREQILAHIGEDYDRALQGLRAGVGRIIPETDLRHLVDTVEQKRAENLVAAALAFEAAVDSPVAVAERAWLEAAHIEGGAFRAIVAFPCRTIEDVAEKARYLLTTEWVQEDGLAEEEVRSLLQAAVTAVSA